MIVSTQEVCLPGVKYFRARSIFMNSWRLAISQPAHTTIHSPIRWSTKETFLKLFPVKTPYIRYNNLMAVLDLRAARKEF